MKTSTRWRWWLGTTVAVLLAVALATVQLNTFVVATATGSTAVDRLEPCLPGQNVSIMDSPHIAAAAADSVRYTSDPPTSGPHFPYAVAPGIYSDPLPDGLTVHALEHGHIVISYAPASPPSVVAHLMRIAKRYPRDVILVPYPGIDHGIALTAWGRILRLSDVDGVAVATFIERLRGRYDHGWTHPDACAAR